MANREPHSAPIHDDDIDESLWDSPVKPVAKARNDVNSANAKSASASRPAYEEQQSHEQNLRQELANVRKVNEAIEGVIESLGRAKGNMKVRHWWL